MNEAESIEPPAALVLGCNTPHGIRVLMDWIEERTGHAPDFHDAFPTSREASHYPTRYGDGSGYGNGSDGDGSGVGDIEGYGTIDGMGGCGDGYGYGGHGGDGNGGGNGSSFGYGNLFGDGWGGGRFIQ